MTAVPLVTELHSPIDGDGLLLKGYAASWTLDRRGDAFNPKSLDRAVRKFMSTNPVLLFSHRLSLPPVGKVTKAEIHRDRGLWIEAVMPRPQAGTFASEVWDATKSGILKALSVNGKWFRKDRGTHQE